MKIKNEGIVAEKVREFGLTLPDEFELDPLVYGYWVTLTNDQQQHVDEDTRWAIAVARAASEQYGQSFKRSPEPSPDSAVEQDATPAIAAEFRDFAKAQVQQTRELYDTMKGSWERVAAETREMCEGVEEDIAVARAEAGERAASATVIAEKHGKQLADIRDTQKQLGALAQVHKDLILTDIQRAEGVVLGAVGQLAGRLNATEQKSEARYTSIMSTMAAMNDAEAGRWLQWYRTVGEFQAWAERMKKWGKRALISAALILAILLAKNIAHAQDDTLRLQIKDEGGQIAFWSRGVRVIDCTGTGITCTYSAATRTLTVSVAAGGGATITTREVDAAPSVTASIIEVDQADGFVVSEPVGGTARIKLTNVPDSVLATISTAGKVSGAALTTLTSIPSGAGIIPTANIVNSPVNSRCLRIDSGGGITVHTGDCGGGGSLTVEEADAAPTVASVTKIQFDSADGFTVTDETGGQVQIDLTAIPDSVLASSYSGVGPCTNQFVRTLNDNAAPTCATVAAADVAADVATQAEIDAKANTSTTVSAGTGLTGGGDLSTNRTLSFDYSDAGADPTFNAGECRFSNEGANPAGWVCEGETANTIETRFRITDPTSADRIVTFPDADSTTVQPDAGAANNFLTAISALGVISKAQPAFSNISGSTDPDQIGAGTAADDKALVADSASGATWRAIPDCKTENMLTYDAATNTFGCEADSTGAGGGDAITVATVAATDPDFIASLSIVPTLDTVPAPDTIAWAFDYAQTLAGNPALAVSTAQFASACAGGGFISEGNVADTSEQLYCFPAVNGVDTTVFLASDATEITDLDGAGLAISGGSLEVGQGVGISVQANSVNFKSSDSLATDPALSAEICVFTIDGTGGGGLICEGTIANTNEQLYLFPAVDGVDTTNFIAVDNLEITNVDGSGLGVVSGTLSVNVGVGVVITSDNVALKYSDTLAGNPTLNAEECVYTTDGTGGGGFLCEGTTGGNTNEQLYLFPAVDGVDTTNFIAVHAAQVTDLAGNGLAVTAGVLDIAVTAPIELTGDAVACSTCTTSSNTQTLTNKTYDVEGTGNAFTDVETFTIQAAGCSNTTAAPGLDLGTANTPAASCAGTSPHRFGYLDFADGATDLEAVTHWKLPTGWTGNIDISLYWACSAATCSTNNMIWGLQTACIANGEAWDAPTYNTVQDVTDAGLATLHQRNEATQSAVTTTGCAAGETVFLKVIRRLSQAGDTFAGTAGLLEIEVTQRRTK